MCFSPHFLDFLGIDPCFRYRGSQEWQQSSPQSPKPHSLSHALCKSKKIFSLEFRTFTVTLTLNTAKRPFHKTLQLSCQTKLVARTNQQFRTYYNRNSHTSLYEPKFSYCDLDLEDRNTFFAYDTLAYNDVSPYWVWLQMVQRCIRYHPN